MLPEVGSSLSGQTCHARTSCRKRSTVTIRSRQNALPVSTSNALKYIIGDTIIKVMNCYDMYNTETSPDDDIEHIIFGLPDTFLSNLATLLSACQPIFSVALPLKMGPALIANGFGITVPSPQFQVDSTANVTIVQLNSSCEINFTSATQTNIV